MKKSIRKLIVFIIIYLIISSMYIAVHIDFKEPIYYENYEQTSIFYNAVRLIMGIPPVIKGYEGVVPEFLIEIVIKVVVAIILSIYLVIDNLKYKNINQETEEDKEVIKIENNIKLLSTIAKLVIIVPLIIILLFSLYIIYLNIHWVR